MNTHAKTATDKTDQTEANQAGKQKRILFMFGDSPTTETGFGRVMRNLLTRFQAHFDEVWVWGIGYWGTPHEFEGVKIFPAAGPNDQRWESKGNLQKFIDLLVASRATHLWMMQDMWAVNPMAAAMRELRSRHGLKVFYYFPVDAPLEPEWTEILEAVDSPVAYTFYGRDEARRALAKPMPQYDSTVDLSLLDERRAKVRVDVIPHGVDDAFLNHGRIMREEKLAIRERFFKGKIQPGEFLMVNVNANQRRKGLVQSLQILRELRDIGVSKTYRLYLHMPSVNANEGIDLKVVANQLGLKVNEEVFFGDSCFINGKPKFNDEGLRQIYGMADLYLTTTLGEGWGMGITEAMACGVPVAAPKHTSCNELLRARLGLLLPVEWSDVMVNDNSRLRPRVNYREAARAIDGLDDDSLKSFSRYGREFAAQAFCWGCIAKRWLDLMLGKEGAAK